MDVEPSRFGGRIIMLAVTALVLAIAALPMTWYSVSDPSGHPGDSLAVHLGSVTREPSGDAAPFMVDTDELMTWVQNLAYLWLVLAFVFIGAMLLDDELLTMIIGIGCVLVGFGLLLYMGLGIAGAIRGDLFGPTWPHGFSGSTIADEGETYSWGPSQGWWTMLFANVFMTAATMLRSVVVIRQM
jgi:hypothetical protein